MLLKGIVHSNRFQSNPSRLRRMSLLTGFLFILTTPVTFAQTGHSFSLPPGLPEGNTHPPLPITDSRPLRTGNELNSRTTPERHTPPLPYKQLHFNGPAIYDLQPEGHRLISYYLRQYTSTRGRENLTKILNRSSQFIYLIRNEIDLLQLPRELEFLPVVESEFYPWAVSVSGASGLWQFMTNSIAPYGIRVTSWMDERRDPVLSTRGALRKLRDNYLALGDWLLAIGAYNCGLTRMKQAMERGKSRNFWELADGGFLPTQTVHYVPKFLAAASLSRYPGRNGFPVDWSLPTEWEEIWVRNPVRIDALAANLQIPEATLQLGNAGLRYGITPPEPYMLKVPKGYAEQTRTLLADPEAKLAGGSTYKIRSGDTLYGIGKRIGVDHRMIAEMNPGVNPESLRIGTYLLLPVEADLTSQEGLYPESYVLEEYRVKSGDTLWGLARRFSTSPEAIALNNGMTLSDTLHTGRVIQIPLGADKENKAVTGQ